MTTDTKLKCVGCEEILQEDDHTYSNVHNKPLCYGCEESDLQGASTLVKVHGGEIDRVRIGSYVIYDEDAEIPGFLSKLAPATVDVRKWTNTDGWRGHGSTVDNFEGIKVLASGWTTGWADEYHQRKIKFNNFLNEIGEGEYATPFPIYVLMEQTSNVFSQGVDFFTEERYESQVIEWLEEIGYPVSSLKEWLS